MRLQGKTMIVTGGASVIGLATVERCLHEGANLVITDVPKAMARREPQALDRRHGGRCLLIAADVTSNDQVERLVQQTVTELGPARRRIQQRRRRRHVACGSISIGDYLRVIDINLNGCCSWRATRQASSPARICWWMGDLLREVVGRQISLAPLPFETTVGDLKRFFFAALRSALGLASGDPVTDS
jgi:NAD(P)-dependent dehydrogenase (short-subunit alcohol dehydrogenase family)